MDAKKPPVVLRLPDVSGPVEFVPGGEANSTTLSNMKISLMAIGALVVLGGLIVVNSNRQKAATPLEEAPTWSGPAEQPATSAANSPTGEPTASSDAPLSARAPQASFPDNRAAAPPMAQQPAADSAAWPQPSPGETGPQLPFDQTPPAAPAYANGYRDASVEGPAAQPHGAPQQPYAPPPQQNYPSAQQYGSPAQQYGSPAQPFGAPTQQSATPAPPGAWPENSAGPSSRKGQIPYSTGPGNAAPATGEDPRPLTPQEREDLSGRRPPGSDYRTAQRDKPFDPNAPQAPANAGPPEARFGGIGKPTLPPQQTPNYDATRPSLH
jgi:hypothetical protein